MKVDKDLMRRFRADRESEREDQRFRKIFWVARNSYIFRQEVPGFLRYCVPLESDGISRNKIGVIGGIVGLAVGVIASYSGDNLPSSIGYGLVGGLIDVGAMFGFSWFMRHRLENRICEIVSERKLDKVFRMADLDPPYKPK